MLRNYFVILFRSLLRNKLNSVITVSGLTVGLTFALLIGVFIWGEWRVNTDLKDVDRLFLMETKYEGTEGTSPRFFVPGMLGQKAIEQYPQLFETYYRFRDRGVTVSRNDKHFRLQSMIGDSTFFKMFGFPVLFGDPITALHRPNTIVITRQIAMQYFNEVDVVGKSLTISTEKSGYQEYIITAVIADPEKKNSVSDFMNMNAQVFLPQQSRADFNLGFQDEWNTGIITYVKLIKGADTHEAAVILNKILAKEAPVAVSERKTIELSALTEYYRMTNHGSVQKLIISLGAVVVLILLLAITNFINISIGASFSRLKEVGIRKAIGALHRQLIEQFLIDALVLALISATLSIALYEFLHGYFGKLLEVSLPSFFHLELSFWFWMAVGTLLTALLAGGYPAWYLSSTQTSESLKNKFKSVKGTIRFSRALVAFQFMITLCTFIVALVMTLQVSYSMEADLGYDRSMVLIASSVPRLWDEAGLRKMEVAKQQFLTSPKIKAVSLSWGSPNFNFSPYSASITLAGHPDDQGVVTTITGADGDYAKVYGLEVTEGAFFAEDDKPFQPDELVINEAARKTLQLKVGDRVRVQFSQQEFTIRGIVRDFNFDSFHEPISPVAFMHNRNFLAYRYFSFKLVPGQVSESVAEVEKLWKTVFPDDPFDFSFTEEKLAQTYRTELQLKRASTIASVLILIIVLTGVLGLVSLSLAKRNKEIGIRKVLGASASHILQMLTKEYVILMAVSFAVALPISYIISFRWLNGFAYHIELSLWMFAIPVVMLFAVTLIIVCIQSLKTALTNPLKAIQYE